jgi:LacI family transcriptional regulator
MAVEHLISVGCRRIAHLAGPPNLLISQNRLKGYRDALIRHQLPFSEELVVYCDTTLENGIAGAKTILGNSTTVFKKDIPDGIFAVSDLVGIGAMLVIKELGLRIPDDIAVVGFANDRYSSFFEPSLTAVEQPAFEIGQTATELFLKQIATAPEDFHPETRVLKTRLIIRNSTLKNNVPTLG